MLGLNSSKERKIYKYYCAGWRILESAGVPNNPEAFMLESPTGRFYNEFILKTCKGKPCDNSCILDEIEVVDALYGLVEEYKKEQSLKELNNYCSRRGTVGKTLKHMLIAASEAAAVFGM